MSDCGDSISESGDLNKTQAEQLVQRLKNLASDRAASTGQPISEALKAVAGEMKAMDDTMAKIYKRNTLLTIQAKRSIKQFIKRFPTIGEGLLAYMEGSNKQIPGARNSVDYKIRSIHGKYFGGMIAALEDQNLLREFKSGEITKQIFLEMGELDKQGGRPGMTGNPAAQKIAAIINDTTAQMVARQNRAGAFINKLPGYVIRQTHDMAAIRALGGPRFGSDAKTQSYQAWKQFITPLLNREKTFQGLDPEKFLRNVHEGLYTGTHGPAHSEAEVVGHVIQGNVASKVSQSRVLHFKDAESAFNYNEKFGMKDFREAILSDIHQRARSIGLMENFGPTPEGTVRALLREMKEEARMGEDAAKQVDSVNDRKIMAAMNELTGANEISSNPTLSRYMSVVKTMTQLSKMGGVALSSLFADRAFMHSEMAFQGISHLTTLGKQLTDLAGRSAESKKMLRLMGVAMDGILGNSLSRYSNHNTISGFGHRAQKQFFDVNFLNFITDASKGTAAELMAAHLGEHANLPHAQLPDHMQKMLANYEIGEHQWEAFRQQAWDSDTGAKFITSDRAKDIPDAHIDTILRSRDLSVNDTNRLRERDRLETQLRAYFTDRVDIAIPTPGSAERRLVTQDTKAGTALGEAMRLLMMFKTYPVIVANKVIGRDVYGNGAMTAKQWLLNDHKGKFNLASMIAMVTAAGYLSGVMRDALAGKTPQELVTDGKLNWDVINNAAIRGGGLGIMGEMIANDYDRTYKTFLSTVAGPVFGQLDTLGSMVTKMKHGENFASEAGKLSIDNAPYINLFYIRPILNYYVLWNLQEMTNPGSLEKMKVTAAKRHQEFYVDPTQH